MENWIDTSNNFNIDDEDQYICDSDQHWTLMN